MREFEDFKKNILDEMESYAQEKDLEIYTNSGIGELKPLGEVSTEEEIIEYWICKGNNQLANVRFVDHEDYYMVISRGGNSISLTLDKNLDRLTSYPSQHFNNTVDRVINENRSISTILDLMLNSEIMFSEYFKA